MRLSSINLNLYLSIESFGFGSCRPIKIWENKIPIKPQTEWHKAKLGCTDVPYVVHHRGSSPPPPPSKKYIILGRKTETYDVIHPVLVTIATIWNGAWSFWFHILSLCWPNNYHKCEPPGGQHQTYKYYPALPVQCAQRANSASM